MWNSIDISIRPWISSWWRDACHPGFYLLCFPKIWPINQRPGAHEQKFKKELFLLIVCKLLSLLIWDKQHSLTPWTTQVIFPLTKREGVRFWEGLFPLPNSVIFSPFSHRDLGHRDDWSWRQKFYLLQEGSCCMPRVDLKSLVNGNIMLKSHSDSDHSTYYFSVEIPSSENQKWVKMQLLLSWFPRWFCTLDPKLCRLTGQRPGLGVSHPTSRLDHRTRCPLEQVT